jgi:hypothetical protein
MRVAIPRQSVVYQRQNERGGGKERGVGQMIYDQKEFSKRDIYFMYYRHI